MPNDLFSYSLSRYRLYSAWSQYFLPLETWWLYKHGIGLKNWTSVPSLPFNCTLYFLYLNSIIIIAVATIQIYYTIVLLISWEETPFSNIDRSYSMAHALYSVGIFIYVLTFYLVHIMFSTTYCVHRIPTMYTIIASPLLLH